MAKAINLLTNDFKEPKSYRFISKTSIVVLSVYITILILIFGISFFLNFQKNKRNADVDQLVFSVQQKKEAEELLTTLKNRTAVAQTIYSKGAPAPSELINSMVALLPSNVSLLNLTVDDGGQITIVIRTENSSGIVEFLNKVRSNQLTSVAMNTLALNTEGYYIVSLDIRP